MTSKASKIKEERKAFYYEDDREKPILAAGVLLVKNNEVLVQKLPKDDSFQFSDFGGKVDMTDISILETLSRELSEEINCGIYLKKNKVYLHELELREMIEKNMVKQIYAPNCKYLVAFVNFDEKKYGLDMEKIGNKEDHDNIERTVQWITGEQFINSHFEHHLHPRLWGKPILEFFGYDGQHKIKEEEEVIVTKLKKFAFKSQ